MDDDILASSSDLIRTKTYYIHPLSETHAQYNEGALIKKERDEKILKYFTKRELCLHGRNDFTNKASCGSRVKKKKDEEEESQQKQNYDVHLSDSYEEWTI